MTDPPLGPAPTSVRTLGIFPGEGIGPEVVEAALTVLRAVEASGDGPPYELRFGGSIGIQAIHECGRPLSDQAREFCTAIFKAGGAILTGAGGDRFVYETRRQFGLYCKLNPLIPSRVPLQASRLRPGHADGVDVLVVRENLGGIYQGVWDESHCEHNGRVARQEFSYREGQVRRIIQVAASLARERRGDLTVVVKPNGVPTISRLWLDCARELTAGSSLKLSELEIDYAAFALIQDPHRFDVIVTPNLFGDILSDVGGVLLGSRGLCYGGSFSASGAAIYQTNHGAAHDLAGTDRANPVGQILALAMMLHETFGATCEAARIRLAVEQVWRRGFRTDDLAEPGCQRVGTQELAALIAAEISDPTPG